MIKAIDDNLWVGEELFISGPKYETIFDKFSPAKIAGLISQKIGGKIEVYEKTIYVKKINYNKGLELSNLLNQILKLM